jgi:hypothetical protein
MQLNGPRLHNREVATVRRHAPHAVLKMEDGPMNHQPLRAVRTRWAAIGAAIAVSIGGGGLAITHAAVDTGERDVFVPITPCRVFDLRPSPDQVGTRGVPLQAGETIDEHITGTNGNCTFIPSDATAVAMNVTAVGGTANSFLTIWPGLTPKPLTSSLNWVAGAPPAPNKVDVKLGLAGNINIYNQAGSVGVLADIVGYYVDHNHDDRYYPRAETYSRTEVDARIRNNNVLAGGNVNLIGSNVGLETFGDVVVTKLGVGSYNLQLLRYNPGCSFFIPNPTTTATLADDPGFVTVDSLGLVTCSTGDTSIRVTTRDMTGAQADRAFTFVVYTAPA